MKWAALALLVAGELVSSSARAETPDGHGRGRETRTVLVSELVARMRDDLACNKVVKERARRNEDAAWAILVACIRQDKFRSLRALLSPPWQARFRKLPPAHQVRLAAQVLATAGRWREADLRLMRENGVRVERPEEARAEVGPGFRGYVLFRGRVTNRTLQADGRMRLYIAEMAYVERTGSRDVWEDTGYDVVTAVGDLPILVTKGNEYVFLARARRADQVTTFVDVVDVFTPGVVVDGLGGAY